MTFVLGRTVFSSRVSTGFRCLSSIPPSSSIVSPAAVPTSTPGNTVVQNPHELASLTQDLVHVKLSYLLPSGKPEPEVIRAGDLKTGRVRPTPQYVPLSAKVFATTPRRDVLHAAVVYYLDGQRSGTASTKTRAMVAYSGAKIRPQKGTGSARLGTRSNPLLRKGGVIHGPRPRDMSSKLNRRVRELALRGAISSKWLQGDLFVVKDLDWIPPPNTNALRKILKAKRWDDTVILTAPRYPSSASSPHPKVNAKPSASDPHFTSEQVETHARFIKNLVIAANNIPRVNVIALDKLKEIADKSAKTPEDRKKPSELHAYNILQRKTLICDLGAIEWLEEKLGGSVFHNDAEGLDGISEEDLSEQLAQATIDDEGAAVFVEDDILDEADRTVPRAVERSRQK